MIRFILTLVVLTIQSKYYGQGNLWSVETTLDRFNLNGPVQEITVAIERNYDYTKLKREVIREYELLNFWEVRDFPMGKWFFDQFGFVTSRENRYMDDTLVHTGIKHRMNKTYIFLFNEHEVHDQIKRYGKVNDDSFPAFKPGRIEISYKTYQKEGKDTLRYSYTYIEEKPKEIRERMEYQNKIEHRQVYSYNDDGMLTSITAIYNQNAPPKARSLMYSAIYIGRSFYLEVPDVQRANYSFQYDSLKRINKAWVRIPEGKLWEEQYSYINKNRSPSKIDRFIVSGFSYGQFFTDNECEWYNHHGDPIRTENYDDQGNLVKTRFYDYVYDDHNNWIQCDMYLEGGPTKTSLPTIRLHRDIQYYE